MMSILSAKKYQIFLFLLQYSCAANSAVRKMKNKIRKKKFPKHYRQINESHDIQNQFFTIIAKPDEISSVLDRSNLTEIMPSRGKGITLLNEAILYLNSRGSIT